MARRPRFDASGAIHHVVAKGVARTDIVRDDYDRRTLWTRLGRATTRYRWRCLAFCLMDTHLHLLLQTVEPNLSAGMQWLCGRYAQDFNARWARSGHLFGGRFFSRPVSTHEQLLATITYVLRNPVRAGMVERSELWPWSSYAATAGLVRAPSFLDVETVLGYLDPRPDVARRALVTAVQESSIVAEDQVSFVSDLSGV